jgi:TetR/AcrR family transcriptional regulator, transcriptional repressor for nem operon
LLVNSALESAPHDEELRQIVATFLGEVESFFLRCVASGQRDRTIPIINNPPWISRGIAAR